MMRTIKERGGGEPNKVKKYASQTRNHDLLEFSTGSNYCSMRLFVFRSGGAKII